jgi:hypothetical protein
MTSFFFYDVKKMCISDTVYRNDIQVKKKTEKKNLDERFRWISLLSFKEILIGGKDKKKFVLV